MARSAVSQAERAAEALEAFLGDRRQAASAGRGPHGPTSNLAAADGAIGDNLAVFASRRAHEMAPAVPRHVAERAPLRLPHSDWLRHRLAVTGPTAAVTAFQSAASGAGTIPWRLDLESLEEDWFHRLINPSVRQLSLAGARRLAGQLREAVERRHAIAVSRVGRSRACPFDLHALVPVPAAILPLGPDHPDALAWLWEHWGTTETLRHVVVETMDGKAGLPQGAGEATLRLRFWSADWTPWQALARVRADWPTLRFDVQPQYDAG